MFTHLRLQSCYSFLRGLASPQDLAHTAASLGYSALALTEHHSLTGAIEFYDACHTAGLQPILGLEVNVAAPSAAPPGVLALLALDLSGWRSLCRMSSALDGDEATLSFEQLAQESAGLLCLTGGRRGALIGLAVRESHAAAAWLGRLSEVFPGRLYVEAQRHTAADDIANAALADLARRCRLPLVATHDVHYLTSEQAHLQGVVSAIRRIQPFSTLPQEACAPPNAGLLSPTEMESRFAEYPTALAATGEIAARCRLELPLGVPRFPEVSLPPGQTALEGVAVLKRTERK